MILKKKEFILAFYAFLGVSTSFAAEELKTNFSPSLQGKNLKEKEVFNSGEPLKTSPEGYQITPSGFVLVPGKAISLQPLGFHNSNSQSQATTSVEIDTPSSVREAKKKKRSVTFSPDLERIKYIPRRILKTSPEGDKITPSGLVLIPRKAISLQPLEFHTNNLQRQGAASIEIDTPPSVREAKKKKRSVTFSPILEIVQYLPETSGNLTDLIPGKEISLQTLEFRNNNLQSQVPTSVEIENPKKRIFSMMITGGQKSNFGGKKVINLNNLLIQN